MYKKMVFLTILFSCLFLLTSNANSESNAKYVGAKMCMMCHRGASKGMVADIWEKSKHAQAYKTLETAAADSIAKAKGLKTSAKDSPECLKCHVVGETKEGVVCEACHGPGSEYKNISIMKDKQKALATGLVIPSNDPKVCQKCHNSESPTPMKFDYKEMWAKIKHPVKNG